MMFTSCGLDYRYALDESLHNQIEYVRGEDGPSHIIYQGETYRFAGRDNFFRVGSYRQHEEDTLLSWNGERYLGYIDEYYSDGAENPLFIYEERNGAVYFREDYSYETDTFVVGDTGVEIVFADILASKQTDINFDGTIEIALQSKTNSRIRIIADLGRVNDQWYISFFGSDDVWLPSDAFMTILKENLF